MPPPLGGSSGATPQYGLSLTTGGTAPPSPRYDRLTPVARVAGPGCLAGDPLLDCVPARLSSVASMAPGDVCHAPRCSLVGLGPVALEYRPCHGPGGSAGSPQCGRPWGCRPLRPVPLLPSVQVRVRCWPPWSLFSGARAVCGLGVLLVVASLLPHPPKFFLCSVFILICFAFFFENEKGGVCTLHAQAWATGAAVL